LGCPASAVELSTMPTICTEREPISRSSPTLLPSVLDTAASSVPAGVRPLETVGIPGPCAGAPNTLALRVESPSGTVIVV
jgi:hypothetical protein